MRYFICQERSRGEGWFILAEVVAEPIIEVDGIPKQLGITDPMSLARCFQAPGVRVLSHRQLCDEPAGRDALDAWERGDDSVADEEKRRELDVTSLEDVRMLAAEGREVARKLIADGAGWQERVRYLWEQAMADELLGDEP